MEFFIGSNMIAMDPRISDWICRKIEPLGHEQQGCKVHVQRQIGSTPIAQRRAMAQDSLVMVRNHCARGLSWHNPISTRDGDGSARLVRVQSTCKFHGVSILIILHGFIHTSWLNARLKSAQTVARSCWVYCPCTCTVGFL